MSRCPSPRPRCGPLSSAWVVLCAGLLAVGTSTATAHAALEAGTPSSTRGAWSDADLVPADEDAGTPTTTYSAWSDADLVPADGDQAAGGVPSGSPSPGSAGPTGRSATVSAGSLPVGTAQYPAPEQARWVAPDGRDSAAGTRTSPWRTVAQAVRASSSGSTIVLRAGTYAESVTVPSGKQLTIQAAAGEAVWFDGSEVVTGWTAASGDDWRLDGWTEDFDHSPTYTAGAPDSTEPGWSFVNDDHPMAAYPEQVFVDGVPQQQVRTRDQVLPGTFYADRAGDRLYLGTDPTGKQVRSSVLETAFTVNGEHSVLRGIGVRRYATSVPLMGTVRVLADDVQLENVHVLENATQGVFLRGSDLQIRNVTAERNGLMGILANHADDLTADRVRADGNNTEHFNGSPAAGGFKLTRLRGVTVTHSSTSHNEGSGLWFDESVYDATVIGNDVLHNTRNGISFEISSKAVFADNLLAGNGTTGLKINNAQDVQIWNNTIADNQGRPVWLVQDSRVAKNLSEPGHDPRQSLPDPTVTWVLGPITVMNNILTAGGANCLLCLQDSALLRSAESIGVTANGNVYARPTSTSPRWISTWTDGSPSPDVYTSVRAFRSAEDQESTGKEFTGTPVLDSTYQPVPALLTTADTTAQPLDSTIATLTEQTAGEHHLGAWIPDAPAPEDEAQPTATPSPSTDATATATPQATATATPSASASATTTDTATPSLAPSATSTRRTTDVRCKPGRTDDDGAGGPPGQRCRTGKG